MCYLSVLSVSFLLNILNWFIPLSSLMISVKIFQQNNLDDTVSNIFKTSLMFIHCKAKRIWLKFDLISINWLVINIFHTFWSFQFLMFFYGYGKKIKFESYGFFFYNIKNLNQFNIHSLDWTHCRDIHQTKWLTLIDNT